MDTKLDENDEKNKKDNFIYPKIVIDDVDALTLASPNQFADADTVTIATAITNTNLTTAADTITNMNSDGSLLSFRSFQRVSNKVQIKSNVTALVILCLCAFVQNVAVGGANNAILSTIERAYYLSSMESAIFLSIYDVANIIASK